MIPIFSSEFSISRSVLNLNDIGDYKDNAPKSIFDLCHKYKINDLFLVDNAIHGFPKAYQGAQKAKVKLRYGLRMTVCADITKKDEESFKTEHDIIVFLLNTENETKDLDRISSFASVEGFYYKKRIDEANLKRLWTPNLAVAIDFYNGFIARNTLSFAQCLFDCDTFSPVFFLQENSLPFDKVLRDATAKFNKDNKFETLEVKSIFYEKKSDFKNYLVRRAIEERGTMEKPKIEYLSSDEFCLEEIWKLK
jgi:DNA polymerase III alpha subunit